MIGIIAGLIWAAVAPRVQYQVYTLKPPTAYATNPETSAFIAADGWYCFIALAGGALIGLLGYLFAVRRYGAWPMAGVVVGSIAAAFITQWLGHRQSGGPGFDHLLATSKPGNLSLRADLTRAPTAHSPSGRWRPRRSPAGSSWWARSGPGASCRTAGSRCRAWTRSARAASRKGRARARRRLLAIRGVAGEPGPDSGWLPQPAEQRDSDPGRPG